MNMEQTIWSKQKKAIIIFLVFLGFMAVCTVAAKGIYRAGLARVTVEKPVSLPVTQSIRVTGSVCSGPEYGIYVPQGLRIQTVLVQKGDIVEAGQTLLCLAEDDLADQIKRMQLEIAQIRAQLADWENAMQESGRDQNLEAARLQEDYDRLVRKWDIQIAQKRQVYENAKRMREEGEDAVKTGSVSGGDAAETEGLKAAEASAAWDVEAALLDKEDALMEWQRSLQDAQKEKTAALAERTSLQGELSLAEDALVKLKELAAEEGCVIAEEAGVILDCGVRTGERTGDGACLLYSEADSGRQIEAVLNEEQYRLLSVGDTVELSYKLNSGENRKEKGVVVYLESEEEQSKVRIGPPAGMEETAKPDWSVGQSVQLQYEHKSERYELVIPTSALYTTQTGGCYVYVVEKREGILGMEDCVRRVDVTVLERNSSLAAIEGNGITQESLVVCSTGRALEEDSVVRVME